MTDSIDAELETLAEEFDFLGDGPEQLQHVMDMGRALPPLTPAEMNEANRVPSCASPAWLVTEPQQDGRIVFRGASEALIPRGVIAVLLRLFSGRTPAEILAFDARAGLERLGLASMLSMSRSNGLASMAARIRRDADVLAQAHPTP